MSLKQYLKTCSGVCHTTLNPKSSGVCRIHLVPKKKPKPSIPWVVIINGYSVLPLQSSWAVLLKIFIENLNKLDGMSVSDKDVDELINQTINGATKVFPGVDKSIFKEDLGDLIKTFLDLAKGIEPDQKIGYLTLSQYAKYMASPHRMDLMLSSMEKNGRWHCNQKCLHCYAANEVMASTNELSTFEWKRIIDKCQEAMIPQLTFTGGEATLRDDLVELIEYSKWFVTRLNTNGILLTESLCRDLYNASLDSVQVTLYSFDKKIHNRLVGGDHFDETVRGIKNAIEAGLDVSINTPLCSLNSDYVETIKFGQSLGVKYFSSSGLIPSGNALNEDSMITKLSREEIYKVICEAHQYAKENDLEIAFTSPGWISERNLKIWGMVVPSCGACLSNMAVCPNGDVVPCQSWLNGQTLGNLLEDDWKKIWNNKETKKIRNLAATKKQVCLLKGGSK